MVDVVAAEAGAYQLLEQVGLFVAAFCRAETGERLFAMRIADLRELATGEFKRFFPRGFAEHIHHPIRVHDEVASFWRIGAADERLGQAVRMMRIVETVATLHAQTLMIRRAIATIDEKDFVVLHVVGQLATDTTVRTD